LSIGGQLEKDGRKGRYQSSDSLAIFGKIFRSAYNTVMVFWKLHWSLEQQQHLAGSHSDGSHMHACNWSTFCTWTRSGLPYNV